MRVIRRLAQQWELRIDTDDSDYPVVVHTPDGDTLDYATAIETGYVERVPIPELVLHQLEGFDDEVKQAQATARGYT